MYQSKITAWHQHGCIPAKLDLHKYMVVQIWTFGHGLPIPGLNIPIHRDSHIKQNPNYTFVMV